MQGEKIAERSRRHYLKLAGSGLAASVGLAGCTSGGSGGDFPSNKITFINPSRGGGYGAYAQALSKYMPDQLPSEVEMAVTSIGNWTKGTAKIGRADPDGHTIGWVDVPGIVGNQIAQDPGFNLRKFSLVGRVAFHPFSIAVPKDSPYESVKDLQNADEVTFGAPGGAVVTILTIIGSNVMDLPMKLVTGYKGSSGTVTAMLRGDVEAVSLPPTTPPMARALENDEIRLLVFYGEEPPETAQGVPTAADLGYDALMGQGITRLVGGPPGIDQDKLDVLSGALLDTIESDDGFKSWAKDKGLFGPLAPTGQKGASKVLDDSFSLMQEYESTLKNHI